MANEKFRTWKFKGDIKVKYSDNTGSQDLWTKNQEELLNQIIQVVNTFSSQDIKLTSRQLCYQLVSANIITNAEKTFKRIGKFLTDARYAGLVDWDAIEDRGRVPEKHSEWDSVKDLISSAVSSYRLPRWQDQDCYVELYCEKQAMESVLKPVADKYHIFFGYNKGYSSASTMYDLSKRCAEQINNGKRVVVLYLGDHDPSGLDMVRDVKDRIEEFLTKGDECIDTENFEVVPLALNMAQIRQYKLPPNPAKTTDTRAKGYIPKYGQKSWELDALRPDVLIKIAENGILDYLDVDKFNAWIALEQEQKKALKAFAVAEAVGTKNS